MAEVVWAPWRMTYILGDKPAGCLFCEMLRAQDDAQNLILWRGPRAFVMLNRYPYNNGHLMVVPHAHAASLTALDSAQRAELGSLVVEEVLSVLKRMALHLLGRGNIYRPRRPGVREYGKNGDGGRVAKRFLL